MHITEKRFLIVNTGKDADLAKHIFCGHKATRDFLIISYTFLSRLKDVIADQKFKLVVGPFPFLFVNTIGDSLVLTCCRILLVHLLLAARRPVLQVLGSKSSALIDLLVILALQVLDECHAIKDSKVLPH